MNRKKRILLWGKENLIKARRAITSAWESLTISPSGLKSERPIHLVPVPKATTSNSEQLKMVSDTVWFP